VLFQPLIIRRIYEGKNKENACPKGMIKKCIYRKPENDDAPGALPRHCAAPIAIVLYCLNRVF
jgi:hypothetical protein